MRKIGVELLNTEKAEAQPLATKKKKKIYENAEDCRICKKLFNNKKKSKYYRNFKKVKDHNYYNEI